MLTSCDPLATVRGTGVPKLERHPLSDELTSKGVRLTARRRLLIEIFQNATTHLDVAALREARKRQPSIDRAEIKEGGLRQKRQSEHASNQ